MKKLSYEEYARKKKKKKKQARRRRLRQGSIRVKTGGRDDNNCRNKGR